MRADRLITLVLLLQKHGRMTAQALAEEVGVSGRTILRDVEALSLAGVPIYAEGGHGGGIALDENYRVSFTGLKDAEVRSLFVAGTGQLLKDVGLGEANENGLLKLFAALPALHQPSVEHIRQRILIDPVWWWHETQHTPFWDELQRAVYEDRLIQTRYETYNGELVERVLAPYSLVAKSSLWYLIAQRDAEFRMYRVSRFHAVTLLDTPFERDVTFDLPTYWQAHVAEFAVTITDYVFTLRIHPERANFAKWLTAGRHDVLDEGDSAGWLTIHFHMESRELAKMLIFGLGAQAEIIDPPELRAEVQNAVRELATVYLA